MAASFTGCIKKSPLSFGHQIAPDKLALTPFSIVCCKSSSHSVTCSLSSSSPANPGVGVPLFGGVRHIKGSHTSAAGFRFALVVAEINKLVTQRLLNEALETFTRYSVKDENIDVVWVPGSFEIGVVAARLGKSKKYDAILCIGAVVRGDTTHYDAVSNSAASGILSASLSSGVPCVFGVLTTEDLVQAMDLAGSGKSGNNKGAEAALTAIKMASLFKELSTS